MSKGFDLRKRWVPVVLVGTMIMLVGFGYLIAGLGDSEGNADQGAQAPTPVSTATPDPGPGLPTRAPVPRPDETRAMDVDAARAYLSTNADLAAMIAALESRDLDAILALAMPGADNYCVTGGRGGLPPGCSSPEDKLPSIWLNQPILRPFWVQEFRRLALPLMSDAGEMRLVFATRDSRTPEGAGGEYYLAFQTERAVNIEDGYVSNGLEMKVRPGAERPIQWFEYTAVDTSHLNWLQSMNEDGAKYHVLVTPESLRDMVGLR